MCDDEFDVFPAPGLMISIVRGYCGTDVLTKAWGPLKMDIPKAPGTGLFLDQVSSAESLSIPSLSNGPHALSGQKCCFSLHSFSF